MKVVPVNFGSDDQFEGTANALVQDYREDTDKKIKFYKSISCCLTTVISLSIVLSILFITAIWVSTFSASLITLADSNRRNEFNKLETYLRQTIKEIESYGQTVNGVLSKELDFKNLNKTENLVFSLFKSQYINTNGMVYLIWVADKDGNMVGFFNPFGSRPVNAVMILQYASITGQKLYYYYCYNFFTKGYCDRSSVPNQITATSGSQIRLYKLAIPSLGKTIWSPSYYDASTPGILHINMLTAFNTTYINDGKDNAVFAYDFAALSMRNYLNESTLHLPGVVAFVLETSTGKNVASNENIITTFVNGSSNVAYKYSTNLQSTNDFLLKEKDTEVAVPIENKHPEEKGALYATDSSHSLSNPTSSLRRSRLSSSFKFNGGASFLSKFELGLENKDVTVVCLKLNSFESWLETADNKEIISTTSLIFQTVQQLAKPAKGQVGNIENGFIFISFNAAIKAENHEIKGCNIARNLIDKLKQLNEGNTINPLPFTMYCAIVTDAVACGNLGTHEVKTFTINGSIQKKIQRMLKKNSEYGISITISEKLQNVITDKYSSRRIENIKFCNNKGQFEDLFVFELGESLHVDMDEWMYEMEKKESKNKWNDYNAGYQLYLDGNYQEALKKFEEYLQRDPYDKICTKMIELCNK
ncbi:hypothetical protein ABK040_003772 [Willaertia magna]